MTRRQILLLVAPPLLVCVAWAAIVWFPQRQRRNDAASQVEATQSLNDNAVVQLASMRALAQNAEVTTAELARLKVRIPDDPDVGGFVLLNQRIALESGIALTDFTPQLDLEGQAIPGADTLPPSLQPTVVTITGTGSFSAVWTYVRALTEAERLVVVDTIDLNSEQVGVVRCSLQVRIFSTRQDPTADAAGVGVDVLGTEAVPQ